ncbi:MAG: MarR family winged helix-turn-helix transcriptional regulator [Actinomycetia bacterium]|nr:MarR family winged helix-turn-helix transcriptional regulator [Actinomycetes bacterium]
MFVFGPLPDDPTASLDAVLDPTESTSLAGLYTLARSGHALLASIKYVTEEHDLTQAQFRLLMVLTFLYPDGARMSETAAALAVTHPSLTELVRSAPDLFERTPDETDGRQVILTASDEGLRKIHKTLPAMARHAISIREALGADDWDDLVEGSDHLFDLTREGSL